MKKLNALNLGKSLNRAEMKNINGGLVGDGDVGKKCGACDSAYDCGSGCNACDGKKCFTFS